MEIGVFERRETEKEQRSEKDAGCRDLTAFPGAVIKHCDKNKKDWGRGYHGQDVVLSGSLRQLLTLKASRSGNTDSRC